jgi:hypothetical protein
MLRHAITEGLGPFVAVSKSLLFAKYSQDTAPRDIDDFLCRAAWAIDPGGGRSTSYSLILT